ncbi:MAG: hypothetical protein LBN10_03410 [Propionibacteriaceae bacterium]|jgi:hypothetical protein|nr:hypothetical protein [Propionibacteriaceae bacterium]
MTGTLDVPFGETVTVVHAAPVTDPYSQTETALDWDDATRTDVEGCVVYPSTGVGSEATSVGRDQSVETLTVLFPEGTDVSYQDRLEWHGNQYEQVGEPFPWRSPFTGWNPCVQATIRRKVG